MHKTRLEAFSDGVLAMIIAFMVLELKVPHGDKLEAIISLSPVFLSNTLSFINVGIYWNNHRMFFAVDKIIGENIVGEYATAVLAVVDFICNRLDENHFTQLPVAVYGTILLMNGLAYFILAKILINQFDKNSKIGTGTWKRPKRRFQSSFIWLP